MTLLYPIVLETEDNGAVSAYVPGLPVYAAAETHAKAERAIRNAHRSRHEGARLAAEQPLTVPDQSPIIGPPG